MTTFKVLLSHIKWEGAGKTKPSDTYMCTANASRAELAIAMAINRVCCEYPTWGIVSCEETVNIC